jgi:hypothetical protein
MPSAGWSKPFKNWYGATYPQLKMLHNKVYTEAEIDSYLRQAPQPSQRRSKHDEAEQEMWPRSIATRLADPHHPQALDEKFERNPTAGRWQLFSATGTIAGHGKIELRKDGTLQRILR